MGIIEHYFLLFLTLAERNNKKISVMVLAGPKPITDDKICGIKCTKL